VEWARILAVLVVAVGTPVTPRPPHRSVRAPLAYGSYRGCLTANRWLGQGCRIRGFKNELANVRWRLWPAAARSRSPAPIGSETGAMPADYRLRPEDFERVEHLGRQAIEPTKHQAIDVADGYPLR
jgi:hypothetical protein